MRAHRSATGTVLARRTDHIRIRERNDGMAGGAGGWCEITSFSMAHRSSRVRMHMAKNLLRKMGSGSPPGARRCSPGSGRPAALVVELTSKEPSRADLVVLVYIPLYLARLPRTSCVGREAHIHLDIHTHNTCNKVLKSRICVQDMRAHTLSDPPLAAVGCCATLMSHARPVHRARMLPIAFTLDLPTPIARKTCAMADVVVWMRRAQLKTTSRPPGGGAGSRSSGRCGAHFCIFLNVASISLSAPSILRPPSLSASSIFAMVSSRKDAGKAADGTAPPSMTL